MERTYSKSYYFAKYPIRRILANQLNTLGNNELATLSRLQMLVWRNPPGIEGNGWVCSDTGQKARKDWVLRTLERMSGMSRKELRRCLNQLKMADEVAFDKSGRPYLKHWRRDKDREPTNTAERKKLLRDRDLVPEAVELLPVFLRSPEARTLNSLCGWLGYKMSRDAKTTVKRVVDLMVDDGIIKQGDGGVFSVCVSVFPSTPSASRPPPSIEAEELKTEVLDTSQTCPTDIETIAKEDYYIIPIEPIDGAPDPDKSAPGTAPPKEGGGQDAEGALCHSPPNVPVGHSNAEASNVIRKTNEPERGRKRSRSPRHNFAYSREWSGKQYPAWVPGTHPHPRRTKVELREFASVGLWDCDLIDGMLFLAPDGYPKSKKWPWGQEGVFKGLLKRINKAAGGVAAADDSVRRVLREFIEDVENQEKPFDQDATILKTKLDELLDELLQGR